VEVGPKSVFIQSQNSSNKLLFWFITACAKYCWNHQ